MQQLKKVHWQIGQPLLPIHLVAQEDSLLAHVDFFIKNQGIPFYGIGSLKWDDTLLLQGVISISKITVIFPSGDIVDVPNNGRISSIDLNKLEKNQVSIYLHLMNDSSMEESYIESPGEQEQIAFSIYQMSLSMDSHFHMVKGSIKLAEFEKNAENQWKLSKEYIPPLFKISTNPFLTQKLSHIQTIVESFQKELEQEKSTGQVFERRTIETKLALSEVAKMRRFLLNADKGIVSHPYFLYEQLCRFLDTIALIYMDQANFSIIPYQHDKLAPLFSKIIEILTQYLQPKSEQLSYLQFEKKENCYVSEKLPEELYHAQDLYFIVQPIDPRSHSTLEGVKLASYSRLSNVHLFALNGISLLRLDNAPFNNNFSKNAQIYIIEKDIEWNYALTEGRLAVFHQGESLDLQAFLYWRL